MKSQILNYYLITLVFIIIISIINSQTEVVQETQGMQIQTSEEIQKFNNCLNLLNQTEIQYQELTKKMKNIKFNIFLKIQYKNLKRTRDKIESQTDEIKKKLNSGTYDKNEISFEISELYENVETFEKKCFKTSRAYEKSEKTKKIVAKFIKIFFITILIVVIAIMIIIGLVSVYVIKRQKYYNNLDEDSSKAKIELDDGEKSQTREFKNPKEKVVVISNDTSSSSRESTEPHKKKYKKGKKKETVLIKNNK